MLPLIRIGTTAFLLIKRPVLAFLPCSLLLKLLFHPRQRSGGGGRVTADIIRLEGIEPATFKFEI